jgi:hypothetical protein
MTARERLPNRRACESFDFEHAGHRFSITVAASLTGIRRKSSYPRGMSAHRLKPLPATRP